MKRTLLDPMAKPPVEDKAAEFPFEWTPPLQTDVRATWDRVCPGWRERRPNQPAPITKLRKVRNG